jgi:hypothetical protein
MLMFPHSLKERHMNEQRIQPYGLNPAYWQYRDKPVLLLGGSDEDNLFQIPVLADDATERQGDHIVHDPQTMNLDYQLNTLVDVGGNFVRCTMSSRDVGDVWPYTQDPQSGKYDLNRFNEAYWARFERFLQMTAERDIIVQVEIWATYDFYQTMRHGVKTWHLHPYNPRNNINYTAEESGLLEDVPSTGFSPIDPDFDRVLNPFFETVPALANNQGVLTYQQSFVNRLLSISLAFDHVLYCIDNETNAHPEWGAYWAHYLHERAEAVGVAIEVTEMWDLQDPTGGAVAEAMRQSPETNPLAPRSTPLNCLERPELYTFSDISNHNAQRGETHYRTGLWFWQNLQDSGHIWPVHCDKMYGGDSGQDFAGTRKDGLERFWRNIFAGLAGCRFHRPPSGIGIDADAQAHIRAMRRLTDELDIFTTQPRPDLLSNRAENTAFCLADEGRAYAVVFVNPGTCMLDVSAIGEHRLRVRWLDIEHATWREAETLAPTSPIELRPPDARYWAVLVDLVPAD